MNEWNSTIFQVMIVLVLCILCFECDHVFNKNSSNFGVRLEAQERERDMLSIASIARTSPTNEDKDQEAR